MRHQFFPYQRKLFKKLFSIFKTSLNCLSLKLWSNLVLLIVYLSLTSNPLHFLNVVFDMKLFYVFVAIFYSNVFFIELLYSFNFTQKKLFKCPNKILYVRKNFWSFFFKFSQRLDKYFLSFYFRCLSIKPPERYAIFHNTILLLWVESVFGKNQLKTIILQQACTRILLVLHFIPWNGVFQLKFWKNLWNFLTIQRHLNYFFVLNHFLVSKL